jgi:hypothetical protein
MATRFLGFVSSLSSSEQQLWFPNQNVQDPDTWTFPHLIQLKQEYKKPYFICLPSQVFIRLLSGIWSYLNRENPARKVQPPSVTVSTNFISSTHEGMTTFWQTNISTASNTRMIEQLALRTPMTFHTTSEQDLNPRP